MNFATACELARSVIDIEAQTVLQLKERIDVLFYQACELLYQCQGRIVVTGVGKSGHISKKIAATFASTGSPAFFVHPGEAKHGDIGMLTSNDVIIALSNSGESEEILAILPIIKRLKVPLITLTGKSHSKLALAATINLDVSVEKEACPLGLAPTSSTTAALVMGDALAMVVLEMRGFTKHDFALSHPGGTLGKRLLLTVDELMHKKDAIPMVLKDTLLKDVLFEMTHKKLGMTTVVNADGELAGIFTDGDIRRTLDNKIDIHQTPIENLMSKSPKTITSHVLAADALNLMEEFKITSLVVINDRSKPIGVLHIHDILRAGVV